MAWFEQGAKPLGAAEEGPAAAAITSAEVEKWERERDQALQEAGQALSTGNATMGTLADQQETLDRAELIAESNEYMLAKSRRTLRGTCTCRRGRGVGWGRGRGGVSLPSSQPRTATADPGLAR